MIITKERVIPGKIALNSEELDIVVDFEILLERIIRIMDQQDVICAGPVARSDVVEMLDTVKEFYSNVSVDFATDEMVIRRANNGQAT